LRRLLVVIAAVAFTSCANDDLVIVFDTTTTSPSTTSPSTTSSPITTTTLAGYGDQVRSVVVDGDALPAFVDSHTDPAIGRPIPTLIGEDYDGTPITVGPDRANPMLLVVLAHWCPHCNNEIPEINAIRDADRWPAGLEVVGISSAIAPDRPNFPPARWLVEKDWTYPVLADGIDETRGVYIAGDALGVTGYPFMVLVDATGAVRGRWSGESPADALVALVTDLINPPADA
jgi:cytochrome c biogenesis protein CcmG/thiol:disulfide interchange protein DsbE